MYTPPVPPVAMLSVLPVKSGPALAGGVVPPDVARGAWQAAPTSSAAIATDRMRELFISTLLAAGGMLAAREPPFASDLGLCHPPPLLIRFGDHRGDRHGSAVVADGDEHEVRRGDVGRPPGEQVLGVDAHADLHAL